MAGASDLLCAGLRVTRVSTGVSRLPDRVEHVVARVNERWGESGYVPVVLDLEDDFEATVATLQRYDLL